LMEISGRGVEEKERLEWKLQLEIVFPLLFISSVIVFFSSVPLVLLSRLCHLNCMFIYLNSSSVCLK
jgi:hypothetical protein